MERPAMLERLRSPGLDPTGGDPARAGLRGERDPAVARHRPHRD
jgi:hypothetical protein